MGGFKTTPTRSSQSQSLLPGAGPEGCPPGRQAALALGSQLGMMHYLCSCPRQRPPGSLGLLLLLLLPLPPPLGKCGRAGPSSGLIALGQAGYTEHVEAETPLS